MPIQIEALEVDDFTTAIAGLEIDYVRTDAGDGSPEVTMFVGVEELCLVNESRPKRDGGVEWTEGMLDECQLGTGKVQGSSAGGGTRTTRHRHTG